MGQACFVDVLSVQTKGDPKNKMKAPLLVDL